MEICPEVENTMFSLPSKGEGVTEVREISDITEKRARGIWYQRRALVNYCVKRN